MKTSEKKPRTEGDQIKIDSRLAKLSLAALGVVFGDISTSPIYAIRECFHGEYGIEVSHVNVLGILSLMFWALFLIVGMKYLLFVFRADNHGEGGVMALTALIRGQNGASKNRRMLTIIALGLFAACLLYGDGMITPAISVLSAIEGIGMIAPVFTPYVIPITIAILIGLFLIQRHGTAQGGGLFGPVILVWLFFLAVTGAVQVARMPQVLSAVFPWHAARFLILNKLHGFVVLGGGFHRIIARYGFMEDPSLDNVFSLARGQGLDLNLETTSFYIGRENLVIAEPSGMARWRANLFIFMSRNAADATSFFRLPADQVIEVGVRLAI
ncbi:MAG: KUP/HAK/KT family potassium transporter [Proteobacteria bacterium]|nr:KUP/HAK/KT family potassium transporter [Pseudomonadota bacterium]